MSNLNFKWGLHANLPTRLTEDQIGSLFFTKDEGSLYLGVEAGQKPRRIQGVVQYYADLTQFKSNVLPPYSADIIYYIASENALVKWTGEKIAADGTKTSGEFTVLNVTASEFTSAINNLSTSVAENAGNITNNATNITNLRTDLGETGAAAGNTTAFARIKQLENAVKALEDLAGIGGDGTSDSLSDRIGALETWQTTADTDIKNLKSGLAGHDTTITDHGTRIENLENWKTDTDSRLDDIEKDIEDLGEAQSTLQGRVEVNEGNIANAQTNISNLQTDLSGISGRVAANEENIETLTNGLEGSNTRIGNLETWKNDTVTPALTDHGTRLGTAEGDIRTIKGNINDITGDISGIDGEITTLKNNLGTNDKADTTAFGRIKDLETAASKASSDIEGILGVNSTQGSAISDLQTRMGTAENDIDNLEKDNAEIKNDIDEIKNNHYTKAEVDNQHTTLRSDLTNQLNSHIAAANALVYVGGVGSTSDWNTIKNTDASVGNTYVVTASGLTLNINGTNVTCYAGDLLIATGTEDNNVIPAANIQWVHVKAGYNEDLASTLRVVGGNGADANKKAAVQLSSYVGVAEGDYGDLGKFFIVSDSNNLEVKVDDENNVNISMVWDSF